MRRVTRYCCDTHKTIPSLLCALPTLSNISTSISHSLSGLVLIEICEMPDVPPADVSVEVMM